jgi:hypothetical protein
MTSISLNERRGLNRQQAIEYLGVKASFFDKEIRPLLHARKLGVSMVFDRRELDTVFEQFMLDDGDVGPTEKGSSQWPKKSQEYSKRRTEDGELIRPTKAPDFKDVLQRIKQRKSG